MLKRFECDYSTFVTFNSTSYSKDKNHVYYKPAKNISEIINEADPETFEYDSLKNVFKDKTNEYFNGKIK